MIIMVNFISPQLLVKWTRCLVTGYIQEHKLLYKLRHNEKEAFANYQKNKKKTIDADIKYEESNFKLLEK
jgi:hypothetical protein